MRTALPFAVVSDRCPDRLRDRPLSWYADRGVGRPPPAPDSAAVPSHPGNSGVFRYTDGSGFLVYDFDSGFLSLHGSATLSTDIWAG